MTEKPPAFQFYPKDFLTDLKVTLMSNDTLGRYIKLLCLDWLEDGLPIEMMDNINKDESLPNDQRTNLQGCFAKHPTKVRFVTNPRLQKERQKQNTWKQKCSAAGKRSGKIRKSNKLTGELTLPLSCDLVGTKRELNTNSSSSSSSSYISTKVDITPIIPKPIFSFPDFWLEHHRKVFARWIDYRLEIKKPLRPMTAQALIDKYRDDPGTFETAVRFTIEKGWQGLREPSEMLPVSNGFTPHSAASTVEKNLKYLKETSNEPIDLNEMLGTFFNDKKVIDHKPDGGGSLVPISEGPIRRRGT